MSKTPMPRKRRPGHRHPDGNLDTRAHLIRRCEALEAQQRGMNLTEMQLDRLAAYLELLQQWQRHLNLTGLRSVEQLIDVLILESLDFLQGEFLSGPMRVLDLGTGAGVPGIPLAICQPRLDLTLLDRSQKKMIFVRRVISRLQLTQCRSATDTAEGLSRRLLQASEHLPDGRFDAIVSRGVGTVAHLLSLAGPLLRAGGVLLLRKPLYTLELEDAATALAAGAWADVQIVPLHGQDTSTVSWALVAMVKQAQTSPCT